MGHQDGSVEEVLGRLAFSAHGVVKRPQLLDTGITVILDSPCFYTEQLEAGQEIAAKHYYRPRNEEVAKKHEGQFVKLKLFTVDEVFGGWQKAQKIHFSDGGMFDQIYQKR